MPAPRPQLHYSIPPATLIAADLIAGLNRLPVEVQVDIAMLVARFWTLRLLGSDGSAAPVLLAFAAFVDRLVDEIEAARTQD